EHGPEVGAVRPPGSEVDDRRDVVPGGLYLARPGREPGGDGVGVDRRTRPVGHGLGGETPELVRPAAGPDQFEPLGHPDVAGVRFADAIAEPGGMLDAL